MKRSFEFVFSGSRIRQRDGGLGLDLRNSC
jgi:hypothetical protein